ncbi:MAG: hypothetical protein HKN11_05175, partial [Rhizobiales bacterium]|nr:hypothetical protein [Hyphomicrobiales bacterium]
MLDKAQSLALRLFSSIRTLKIKQNCMKLKGPDPNMSADIFHADYREFPFWWEAYTPQSDNLIDIPRGVRVAIIGA